MAKITESPNIDLKLTFTVNEQEARALDALAGYDVNSFIKVFKLYLGPYYMEQHENGLVTFLQDIRSIVGPSLSRLDEARKVFKK